MSKKARSLRVAECKTMIGHHEKISLSRQCYLLGVVRSTYYYQPQPTDEVELILLRQKDFGYLVAIID